MTQENLIHDILNELATNPESSERLNNTNEDYHIVAHSLFNFFNELTYYEQKHFILSALSSPNGVPICDFLAGENPEYFALVEIREQQWLLLKNGPGEDFIENNQLIRSLILVMDGLTERNPKTISATLYQTLSSCIEQGMAFSKIEKVLNDKYNELL